MKNVEVMLDDREMLCAQIRLRCPRLVRLQQQLPPLKTQTCPATSIPTPPPSPLQGPCLRSTTVLPTPPRHSAEPSPPVPLYQCPKAKIMRQTKTTKAYNTNTIQSNPHSHPRVNSPDTQKLAPEAQCPRFRYSTNAASQCRSPGYPHQWTLASLHRSPPHPRCQTEYTHYIKH